MNAPLRRADRLMMAAALDERAALAREFESQSGNGGYIGGSHRRRRRGRRGEREADKALHNHATERWMVSYADFITLLFAFFVVMYAMSSVNEGRYRVLSGALSTAFSPGEGENNVGNAPAPQGVAHAEEKAAEEKAIARAAEEKAIAKATVVADPAVKPPAASEPGPPITPADRDEIVKTAERMQHMQQLATKVDAHLQALVRDGQVSVTRGARGIAIEINAAVLFDPAKAELKPASHEALRSVAQVLAGFVEPLQIEGHSDDVPITTREFRSNWELSSARAASVARFLIAEGIAPGRVGIAGYAEFRPLVGNADAQTRARNRRVPLVVLSADDTKPKEGGPKPESNAAN
ncbi:MAG: flagellar motor protein MotB [Burkholderiaceae bacterium]